MRAAAMALLAVIVLTALPAAARPPLPPADPAIILVRDGCGAGWHAYTWKDRWGTWRRKCVPNRG